MQSRQGISPTGVWLCGTGGFIYPNLCREDESEVDWSITILLFPCKTGKAGLMGVWTRATSWLLLLLVDAEVAEFGAQEGVNAPG
jgi:hypothetical protein